MNYIDDKKYNDIYIDKYYYNIFINFFYKNKKINLNFQIFINKLKKFYITNL